MFGQIVFSAKYTSASEYRLQCNGRVVVEKLLNSYKKFYASHNFNGMCLKYIT